MSRRIRPIRRFLCVRPAGIRRAVLALALAAAGTGLTAAGGPATAAEPKSGERLGKCAAGQLCLWERAGFKGERRVYELSDVDLDTCVPLPDGAAAESFANRTGRSVTGYQSRECAETGDFSTYPNGSWTPRADYRVRAFKVWEH